ELDRVRFGSLEAHENGADRGSPSQYDLEGKLVGSGGGKVANDSQHLGARRQRKVDLSAVQRAKRTQVEFETCHHAEVRPRTADTPEELWVVIAGRMHHVAVGGDHGDAGQRIDGESVGALQVPDAAAQRESGDPG